MRAVTVASLAAALAAPVTFANTLVSQTGPNAVRADFALPAADGRLVRGTFFLEFDASSGLSPANIAISARLVDPNDAALRARLPLAGAGLAVPSAFPVMVSVNPPPGSGFQFTNAARVEMYTRMLPYAPDSPYRLFKAEPGGVFADHTAAVLSGSIRMRVRTGGFSDFLVLTDARDAVDAARAAYARLAAKVDDDDVPLATRTVLEFDLDESFEEFEEGDYEDAREALDGLELTVETEAGLTLPNVWRAQRDLDNVSGTLASDALNLDFHLARLEAAAAANGGGDDDDDDGDDD
jgi:hypothetical protein